MNITGVTKYYDKARSTTMKQYTLNVVCQTFKITAITL